MLEYAYDAASNRTGMVYEDGNEVGYTYSPNNWMASVSDAKDFLTQYERDKVGNITHITNPNDTAADIAYDKVYRVLNLANYQTSGAKKTNSAFAYTYNKVGHVTEAVKTYGWRNPPVATETYTYDGLHRLAGVVIDPIKNNGEKEIMSYAYDKVGNRLEWQSLHGLSTQTPTDGFTKAYEYNAANQLLTVTSDSVKKNPNINWVETYTYDPNGNRINREQVDENDKNALIEGVDYSFDPENRLTEVLDYQLNGKNATNRIDRAITTLEYDGGGRRLVKTYDPKSNAAQGVKKRVEYVFDGLDPVAEYEMLNGKHDNFYRGAGGRIITMHNFKAGTQGQMYWYHYNFKGDVVGMTKHNGNSHHNYRYDPYGGVVPENGNFTDPHNHYTLTGKEVDENTGLVYFGARHYDPEVGVWVSQDIHRGFTNYPSTLVRYSYVLNNPTNYYDPFGFRELTINEYNTMVNAFKDVNKDSKEARKVIGGKVNDTANDKYFQNACTLRMSYALNSYEPLPTYGNTTFFNNGEHLSSGGRDRYGDPVTPQTKLEDKLWYARYVREIIPYLENRYDGTTILKETENKADSGFTTPPSNFNGKKGIIVFYVDSWDDATGHVDFWNGSSCIRDCYWSEANKIKLFIAKEEVGKEQNVEGCQYAPPDNILESLWRWFCPIAC